MNHDLPEISFKAVLLVPGGPPEAVWERALHEACKTAEQDPPPEGDAPDADVPGMEVDQAADLLLDEVDDAAGDDSDQTTPDHRLTTSAWAAGRRFDVDVDDAGYGDGLPEGDHDVES